MSDTYSERHGSPHDRGACDSYYGRARDPHYYTGATYSTPRVGVADMTAQEIAAYNAGFDANEADRNFKDWE
jgi:hypothetical protein